MTENKLLKIINYIKNKLYRQATIIFIVKDLSNIEIVKPHKTIEFEFLGRDQAHLIASDDYLKKQQIAELFEKGAICLGAFVDEQLVGYVWGQFKPTQYPFFDFRFDFGLDAYVGPDYVRSLFRGNKIHGALLGRMFTYLHSQGYQSAWTAVWRSNINSIKGLMEVGYQPKFQVRVIRIFNFIVYKRVSSRTSW